MSPLDVGGSLLSEQQGPNILTDKRRQTPEELRAALATLHGQQTATIPAEPTEPVDTTPVAMKDPDALLHGVEGYQPIIGQQAQLPQDVIDDIEVNTGGPMDNTLKNLVLAHFQVFGTWPDFSLTADVLDNGDVEFNSIDEAVAFFETVKASYTGTKREWKVDAGSAPLGATSQRQSAGWGDTTDVLDPEMLSSFRPKKVEDFLYGPYMKRSTKNGPGNMFRDGRLRLDELLVQLPKQWAISNLTGSLTREGLRYDPTLDQDEALMRQLNVWLASRVQKEKAPAPTGAWQQKTEDALRQVQAERAMALYLATAQNGEAQGKDALEASAYLESIGQGSMISQLDQKIKQFAMPSGSTTDQQRKAKDDIAAWTMQMWIDSRNPGVTERMAIRQLHALNPNAVTLAAQQQVGADNMKSHLGMLVGWMDHVPGLDEIKDHVAEPVFKGLWHFIPAAAGEVNDVLGGVPGAAFGFIGKAYEYRNLFLATAHQMEQDMGWDFYVNPDSLDASDTRQQAFAEYLTLQNREDPDEERTGSFIDRWKFYWHNNQTAAKNDIPMQYTDELMRDTGMNPVDHPEMSFISGFVFDTILDAALFKGMSLPFKIPLAVDTAGRIVGKGLKVEEMVAASEKAAVSIDDVLRKSTTGIQLRRTVSAARIGRSNLHVYTVADVLKSSWESTRSFANPFSPAPKVLTNASKHEFIGRGMKLFGFHPEDMSALADALTEGKKVRRLASGDILKTEKAGGGKFTADEIIDDAVANFATTGKGKVSPDEWAIFERMKENSLYNADSVFYKLRHPMVSAFLEKSDPIRRFFITNREAGTAAMRLAREMRTTVLKHEDGFYEFTDRLMGDAIAREDWVATHDLMRIKLSYVDNPRLAGERLADWYAGKYVTALPETEKELLRNFSLDKKATIQKMQLEGASVDEIAAEQARTYDYEKSWLFHRTAARRNDMASLIDIMNGRLLIKTPASKRFTNWLRKHDYQAYLDWLKYTKSEAAKHGWYDKDGKLLEHIPKEVERRKWMDMQLKPEERIPLGLIDEDDLAAAGILSEKTARETYGTGKWTGRNPYAIFSTSQKAIREDLSNGEVQFRKSPGKTGQTSKAMHFGSEEDLRLLEQQADDYRNALHRMGFKTTEEELADQQMMQSRLDAIKELKDEAARKGEKIDLTEQQIIEKQADLRAERAKKRAMERAHASLDPEQYPKNRKGRKKKQQDAEAIAQPHLAAIDEARLQLVGTFRSVHAARSAIKDHIDNLMGEEQKLGGVLAQQESERQVAIDFLTQNASPETAFMLGEQWDEVISLAEQRISENQRHLSDMLDALRTHLDADPTLLELLPEDISEQLDAVMRQPAVRIEPKIGTAHPEEFEDTRDSLASLEQTVIDEDRMAELYPDNQGAGVFDVPAQRGGTFNALIDQVLKKVQERTGKQLTRTDDPEDLARTLLSREAGQIFNGISRETGQRAQFETMRAYLREALDAISNAKENRRLIGLESEKERFFKAAYSEVPRGKVLLRQIEGSPVAPPIQQAVNMAHDAGVEDVLPVIEEEQNRLMIEARSIQLTKAGTPRKRLTPAMTQRLQEIADRVNVLEHARESMGDWHARYDPRMLMPQHLQNQVEALLEMAAERRMRGGGKIWGASHPGRDNSQMRFLIKKFKDDKEINALSSAGLEARAIDIFTEWFSSKTMLEMVDKPREKNVPWSFIYHEADRPLNEGEEWLMRELNGHSPDGGIYEEAVGHPELFRNNLWSAQQRDNWLEKGAETEVRGRKLLRSRDQHWHDAVMKMMDEMWQAWMRGDPYHLDVPGIGAPGTNNFFSIYGEALADFMQKHAYIRAPYDVRQRGGMMRTAAALKREVSEEVGTHIALPKGLPNNKRWYLLTFEDGTTKSKMGPLPDVGKQAGEWADAVKVVVKSSGQVIHDRGATATVAAEGPAFEPLRFVRAYDDLPRGLKVGSREVSDGITYEVKKVIEVGDQLTRPHLVKDKPLRRGRLRGKRPQGEHLEGDVVTIAGVKASRGQKVAFFEEVPPEKPKPEPAPKSTAAFPEEVYGTSEVPAVEGEVPAGSKLKQAAPAPKPKVPAPTTVPEVKAILDELNPLMNEQATLLRSVGGKSKNLSEAQRAEWVARRIKIDQLKRKLRYAKNKRGTQASAFNPDTILIEEEIAKEKATLWEQAQQLAEELAAERLAEGINPEEGGFSMADLHRFMDGINGLEQRPEGYWAAIADVRELGLMSPQMEESLLRIKTLNDRLHRAKYPNEADYLRDRVRWAEQDLADLDEHWSDIEDKGYATIEGEDYNETAFRRLYDQYQKAVETERTKLDSRLEEDAVFEQSFRQRFDIGPEGLQYRATGKADRSIYSGEADGGQFTLWETRRELFLSDLKERLPEGTVITDSWIDFDGVKHQNLSVDGFPSFEATLPNGHRIVFETVDSIDDLHFPGENSRTFGLFTRGMRITDPGNSISLSIPDIIELSKSTLGQHPGATLPITLDHEIFHMVQYMGILTSEEWKALKRLYPTVKGLGENNIHLERVARAYSAWAIGKDIGEATRIFEKIQKFFQELLLCLLKNDSFLDAHAKIVAQRVFAETRSGKIFERRIGSGLAEENVKDVRFGKVSMDDLQPTPGEGDEPYSLGINMEGLPEPEDLSGPPPWEEGVVQADETIPTPDPEAAADEAFRVEHDLITPEEVAQRAVQPDDGYEATRARVRELEKSIRQLKREKKAMAAERTAMGDKVIVMERELQNMEAQAAGGVVRPLSDEDLKTLKLMSDLSGSEPILAHKEDIEAQIDATTSLLELMHADPEYLVQMFPEPMAEWQLSTHHYSAYNYSKLAKFMAGGPIKSMERFNAYKFVLGRWSIDDLTTIYKTIVMAKISTMLRIPLADEATRFLSEGINPLVAWKDSQMLKALDIMPEDIQFKISEMLRQASEGTYTYIGYNAKDSFLHYAKLLRADRRDATFAHWLRGRLLRESGQEDLIAAQVDKFLATTDKRSEKLREAVGLYKKRYEDTGDLEELFNAYLTTGIRKGKGMRTTAASTYRMADYGGDVTLQRMPGTLYNTENPIGGRALTRSEMIQQRIASGMTPADAAQDLPEPFVKGDVQGLVEAINEKYAYWYDHPILGADWHIAPGLNSSEMALVMDELAKGHIPSTLKFNMPSKARWKQVGDLQRGQDVVTWDGKTIAATRVTDEAVTNWRPVLFGQRTYDGIPSSVIHRGRDMLYGILDYAGSKMNEMVYANSFLKNRMANIAETKTILGRELTEEEILRCEEQAHFTARAYMERVMFTNVTYGGEDFLRNLIMFLPAYRQFAQYWVPYLAKHPVVLGAAYRANQGKENFKVRVGGMELDFSRMSFLINQSDPEKGGSYTGWLPSGAPLLTFPVSIMAHATRNQADSPWGEMAGHWPFDYASQFSALNSPLDKIVYGATAVLNDGKGFTLPWPFGSDQTKNPWRALQIQRAALINENKRVSGRDALWQVGMQRLQEGLWNFVSPVGARFTSEDVEQMVQGKADYNKATDAKMVQAVLSRKEMRIFKEFLTYESLPAWDQLDYISTHPEIVPFAVSGYTTGSNGSGKLGLLYTEMQEQGVADPETYLQRVDAKYTEINKVLGAIQLRERRDKESEWWSNFKQQPVHFEHDIFRLSNEWETSTGAFAPGGVFFIQGKRGAAWYKKELDRKYAGIHDPYSGISTGTNFNSDTYLLAKFMDNVGGAGRALLQMSPNYPMYVKAKYDEQKSKVDSIVEGYVDRRMATRLTNAEILAAGYTQSQASDIGKALKAIDMLWDSESAWVKKVGATTIRGKAIRRRALEAQNSIIHSTPLMEEFLGKNIGGLYEKTYLTKPAWEREDFVRLDKMDPLEKEVYMSLRKSIDPKTGEPRVSGPYLPEDSNYSADILSYRPLNRKGTKWEAVVSVGGGDSPITGVVRMPSSPEGADKVAIAWQATERFLASSYAKHAMDYGSIKLWRKRLDQLDIPEWAKGLVAEDARAAAWRSFFRVAGAARESMRETQNEYYGYAPGFSPASTFGKNWKQIVSDFAAGLSLMSPEFKAEWERYNKDNRMLNSILGWYL